MYSKTLILQFTVSEGLDFARFCFVKEVFFTQKLQKGAFESGVHMFSGCFVSIFACLIDFNVHLLHIRMFFYYFCLLSHCTV
jgi:hypothetical protein